MATRGGAVLTWALWTAMQTKEGTGGRGSTWLFHFCRRGRRWSSVDDVVDDFLPHCFRPPPRSCLPLTSPLRARRLYSPLAISWCKTCSSFPPLAQLQTLLSFSVFLHFLLCSLAKVTKAWLSEAWVLLCCVWGALGVRGSPIWQKGARWGGCGGWELLWLTLCLFSSVLFSFHAPGKTSWLLGLWRGQVRVWLWSAWSRWWWNGKNWGVKTITIHEGSSWYLCTCILSSLSYPQKDLELLIYHGDDLNNFVQIFHYKCCSRYKWRWSSMCIEVLCASLALMCYGYYLWLRYFYPTPTIWYYSEIYDLNNPRFKRDLNKSENDNASSFCIKE